MATSSVSQGGLRVEPSSSATKVAYYDGDYISSLKYLLLGTTARDDVPIDLGGTWEAVGTSTTISPTITFIVSNLTSTFNVYWIQLVGATASGSTSSFSCEYSTDDGDTAITAGGKYNFQYVFQGSSFTPTAPVNSLGGSAINIPTTLGIATSQRRTMNLFVYEPANANSETSLYYTISVFDRASPFTTQFGRGWGTHRDKQAHNAIRLNINNTREWTGGTINVWGQVSG